MFRLILMLLVALCALHAADDQTAVAPAATPEQQATVAIQKVLDAMDKHGDDVIHKQYMQAVLQCLETNREDAAMIQFNNSDDLEQYRALVIAVRDAFRQCRAAHAQRVASDPTYQKQVADQQAAAQAEQDKAVQRNAEQQQVATGFPVTKEIAGDNPYLLYRLRIQEVQRQQASLPPYKKMSDEEFATYINGERKALSGKTVPFNILMPLGLHARGQGEVFWFIQAAGQPKFYASDILLGPDSALLFDPNPQTFPFGTVGFRRIQMPANMMWQPVWDESLWDQLFAYSEATKVFARAHPDNVYSLVLQTVGVLTWSGLGGPYASLTYTQVKMVAEPMVYDEQLKPVQIGATFMPPKK